MGKELVKLMNRAIVSLGQEGAASLTIRLFNDIETSARVLMIHKQQISGITWANRRDEILGELGLNSNSKIISVFGDSQPFDQAGSEAWIQNLNKYSNGVLLYGVTGIPGEVVDVNGGVTKVNASRILERLSTIPCIGQIVTQTSVAIEKWGCETTPPNELGNIIYVHGDKKDGESVFGDDAGLEGQFNNTVLDPVLIGKIREQQSLPENIANIVRKDELTSVERQQLMYFAVERKISLTDRLDLEEVFLPGIGDSALVASGGGQSLWQAAIYAARGKPINAIGGLRGPENPKTTIADSDGKKLYRDFLDTAEFMGYLAHAKGHNSSVGFFELWDKYFAGEEGGGYPLSGARLAYNPGNSDVARDEEALGGLNSKMRMITNAAFLLGCLGGYQNLNPEEMVCNFITKDRTLLAYNVAVEMGLAPSYRNPLNGKYHDHGRRVHKDETKETEQTKQNTGSQQNPKESDCWSSRVGNRHGSKEVYNPYKPSIIR